MASITPKGLINYLVRLLRVPRIVQLIHTAKGLNPFLPSFHIVETCGPSVGGQAFNKAQRIHVSSWILKNASVAKGVVRHELAHLIHSQIGTGGLPHGKEFKQVLKTIAPKTWRKDRTFRWEPEIVTAYTTIHPQKATSPRMLFIPFIATVHPTAVA